MMRQLAATTGIGVVLVVLWVLNCSGPRPAIGDVRLVEPTAPGAPYRVEAAIENHGRGAGEVAVALRLREQTSGWTVQENVKVQLETDERTLVVAEIAAPAGHYAPEVEVAYPPR